MIASLKPVDWVAHLFTANFHKHARDAGEVSFNRLFLRKLFSSGSFDGDFFNDGQHSFLSSCVITARLIEKMRFFIVNNMLLIDRPYAMRCYGH